MKSPKLDSPRPTNQERDFFLETLILYQLEVFRLSHS